MPTKKDIAIIRQMDDKEVRTMFYAIQTLKKLGGTGVIEIHLVRGEVKEKNGVFIKPWVNDAVVRIMETFVVESNIDTVPEK